MRQEKTLQGSRSQTTIILKQAEIRREKTLRQKRARPNEEDPVTLTYSPHMPRRGAPQPQGPASAERPPLVPLLTAKTESSFSRFGPWQEVHSTESEARETIFSNRVPQSWHLYSNSGICSPARNWDSKIHCNRAPPALASRLPWRNESGHTQGLAGCSSHPRRSPEGWNRIDERELFPPRLHSEPHNCWSKMGWQPENLLTLVHFPLTLRPRKSFTRSRRTRGVVHGEGNVQIAGGSSSGGKS